MALKTNEKIPHTELVRFLDYCTVRKLPPKRAIIKPGDPADTLFYIIEGAVTVSIENDDGGDIILSYLNPGDFVGETGLFIKRENREVIVRTRSHCTIAHITYERLEELSKTELKDDYASIIFLLGKYISTRLLQATKKVGHLAFMDASGRIVQTLLELCRQPDALSHPQGMQIKVSRTELGRIVGCSREMVGRVLKTLEHDQLIQVAGKTIVVVGNREEILSPDATEHFLKPAQ
ncbi:MAG: cAMP-activated global transcriptional regulator CRP [Gammaproteobacteria bacterium]|nr:cAMP-activated global transcriptional regulator CRP [Gammaproteobacteria bacterium]